MGRMMLKKRKAQCMMIAIPKSNTRQVLLKKSAKKLASQLKYVTVGYDKCRKTMVRNQSKRVDCKARVNCKVINDYSCIVTKVILEHNHELDPTLSYFLPSHRELSRVVKRSLVAHDIAGLRPSKSIRLLEVEDEGPERMSCTPKECRNYILQQRRLQTLSSDVTALHRFFVDMQPKDKIFFIQYTPTILADFKMLCGCTHNVRLPTATSAMSYASIQPTS
ncbi:hypothetical protein BC332_08010 [Capsicum chinense]|nr:hypothetical protein BC332_08010 [Capsicum chinense]